MSAIYDRRRRPFHCLPFASAAPVFSFFNGRARRVRLARNTRDGCWRLEAKSTTVKFRRRDARGALLSRRIWSSRVSRLQMDSTRFLGPFTSVLTCVHHLEYVATVDYWSTERVRVWNLDKVLRAIRLKFKAMFMNGKRAEQERKEVRFGGQVIFRAKVNPSDLLRS